MPTNSYGKTVNNIYIDTIYIDNNSSTTMGVTDGYNTTNGNYLYNKSNLDSNLTKNYGSRWILQVTNGSGSTINFNTNNFRLNVCTNYKDDNGESEDEDYNYYLVNGTLSANQSIYFGWGNSTVAGGVLGLAVGTSISSITMASNPPSDGDNLDGKLIPGLASNGSTNVNYLLLADQVINNNILVATRFRLRYGSGFIENFGLSTVDDEDSVTYFNNSIKRFLLFSTGNNNSGTTSNQTKGYISRNPTVTSTSAPTTTYAESDWINRGNNECKTPDYYLINHATVEDGTAKTYNGIYIDTIYIDNNNSTTMGVTDGYNTSNGNYLSGLTDLDSNITKDYGSRWAIQVTNGSGSTIDFNTNNLRLNVCTNYKDNNSESEDRDYNYYLVNGTLANNKSIYFGWGNSTVAGGVLGLANSLSNITLASNPPTNGENLNGKLIPGLDSDGSTNLNYLLLADQIISNNTLVSTRFRLRYSTGFVETVGLSTVDNDDNVSYFNNSIKRYLLFTTGNNNSGSSRNVNAGTINRKSSVTSTNAPTTTYAESDWEYKCTSSIYTIGNHLTASAVGDPHIKTLNGESYKFDYLGAFRLFDNNEDLNNRIIINGYSELGKGEKWKNNQYITKIFIFNKGNYCLINTGYRGEKAKIEKNYGINIDEKELEFNDKAKVYCHDCNRNINHNDFKKIYKHKIKNKHVIPYTVRNLLTIKLELENYEDLIIQISNVNEYNLQPCRIKILNHPYIVENINKLTGCIVNRKYSITSKLNNINSILKIKEPDQEELIKLPKLERRPELINTMFN